MELLFATALRQFQDEGCGWLHLGFTPFVQLGPDTAAPARPAPSCTAAWRCWRPRGAPSIRRPPRSPSSFKWHQQLMEPEYLAFQGRVSPGAVRQLMRLTKSV